MTDKVIEYKSAEKIVTEKSDVLETIIRDGIACTWRGKNVFRQKKFVAIFSWNFDWSQLKTQEFDRITGYIILKANSKISGLREHKIDIDFKNTKKSVVKEYKNFYKEIHVSFEYRFTPYYGPKIVNIPYDEMFAASEMNDTVLVIGRKKLHVNKMFLSYHSEFFRALFSSNFKEGQMTEIPITGVSYEDFRLLMSIIHPKQRFPTDETAETLLELADRFLMDFVTRAVENHLLEHTKLKDDTLLCMADQYGIENLLEKCIYSMDTVTIRALQQTEEFENLSSETREKLIERLVDLF